jgi:hypothetical protein
MTSSLNSVAKIVLIALFVGLSGGTIAGEMQSAAQGVKGTAKADSLQACVRPTSWMRRNHMELIKHSRYMTVHEGIRIHEKSLAGCVDCHARKDKDDHPVPVNAKGEFCDACHSYVGESLPCFQCHSTVPSDENP